MDCARCMDERWVCETHDGLPWGRDEDGCGSFLGSCSAPGMPCPDCNDRLAYPPGSVEVWRAHGEALN